MEPNVTEWLTFGAFFVPPCGVATSLLKKSHKKHTFYYQNILNVAISVYKL